MTETPRDLAQEGLPAPIVLGWIMIFGGALVAGLAYFYNVGVSTGSAGLYGMPEEVANADKMAFRSMLLATGLAVFVSGWIALIGGLILEELKRS